MSDFEVSPEEKPVWLDTQFFHNLLEIREAFKVKSVKFACAKGENFASKIFRVELDFGDAKKSETLIVKSRPCDGGFSEEFTKKFNIYPKEIEAYELIDHFEELFHEIGIDVTFSPK